MSNAAEKIRAVADAALMSIDSLIPSLLPDAKREGGDYVALNPTRADKKAGSFRVTRNNGKWRDAATDEGGGDLVSLWAYIHSTSQLEAAKALASMVGLSGLFGDDCNLAETKAMLKRVKDNAAIHRKQAEAEEKAAREKAAVTAAQLWEAGLVCSEHSYLAAKGVKAHGLKTSAIAAENIKQGVLLIPLYKGNKLVSVQAISAEGKKQFLAGGETVGAAFVIEGEQPAIVCEGYATGASVHEITGRKVYVAFNAGNLLAVAKANPDIQLVAADNDSEKTNTGEQAAKSTGLAYAMPPEAGDWNDYHQRHGIEAARSIFRISTRSTPEEVLNKLFAGRGDSYIQVPDAIKQTVIGRLASKAAHTLEMPLGSSLLILLAGASASVATSYATQFRSGTRVALGLYATAEQPPSTQKSRIVGIGFEAYQRGMGGLNKAIYEINSKLGKDDLKTPFAFNHVTDATSAALDKELANKDSGRFLIQSAEQAAFQTLFPETGSYSSNNGLLLNGWAGEWVAGARAGRDSFTGIAWGTIALFAQHGSIKRVLNASQGQGLTERFIFASEPTKLGNRTFNNGYLMESDKQEFNLAAAMCIKQYREKLEQFSETDRQGTSLENLYLVYPCNEGYDLMQAKKIELEPFLGELNQKGEITYLGWLGKIETHTLKIAGVLHVFDCLGSGSKQVPEVIPLNKIQAALDLVLAIGTHIRRLIQDSGEAGQGAEAETILSLVSEGKGKLKKTDTALKAKNRTPFRALNKGGYKAAQSSINELLELGLLGMNEKGFLYVS